MAENLSFDQVPPVETLAAEERRRQAAVHKLVDWMHIAAVKRLRKHKQAELRREAEINRTKAAAYRDMAQYAINLAAKRESSPAKRITRRRELSTAWRNMRERLSFKTSG